MIHPGLQVVAGLELLGRLREEKEASVPRSAGGLYASEPLCRWQAGLYASGIRGVEIVRSVHGCSVRSDSGCDNFALVASWRLGNLPKGATPAQAADWARAWVARDPERRYAWTR